MNSREAAAFDDDLWARMAQAYTVSQYFEFEQRWCEPTTKSGAKMLLTDTML